MELTPCLGIGDFLILKMICLSEKLTIKKINFTRKIINNYRQYPERFQQFITKFVHCLFPEVEIAIVDSNLDAFPVAKYSIRTPYIYDQIHLTKVSPPIYNKYIVFHTKVRMECQMAQFVKNDLPLITKFLKTYHTDKTILIMGERVIEDCCEKRDLGIISLYDEYKVLSKNNTVIDLTKDVLFSGNPDYDDFEHDLNLIHHADLNIIVGIGGPLNICFAMSQHNLAYIGVVNSCKWVKITYPDTYQDMTQFLAKVAKATSMKK